MKRILPGLLVTAIALASCTDSGGLLDPVASDAPETEEQQGESVRVWDWREIKIASSGAPITCPPPEPTSGEPELGAEQCDPDGGGYPDPDPNDDSQYPADGEGCHTAEVGVCDMEVAEGAVLDRIRATAAAISTAGKCGEIRQVALEMVNRPVKVWYNEVLVKNKYGKLVPLEGETEWNNAAFLHIWFDAINEITLIHEALHAMSPYDPYEHEDKPMGKSFKEWEQECSR